MARTAPHRNGQVEHSQAGKALHSVDAERQVLGNLILDPDAFHTLNDRLEPEHFWHPPHAVLFAAMRAMFHGGEVVDRNTLIQELERRDVLAEIGGRDLVLGLAGETWTAVLDAQVDIIIDCAQRRKLIEAAKQILHLVPAAHTSEDALGDAQQLLLDLSEQHTSKNLVQMALCDAIHGLQTEFVEGRVRSAPIPTGYYDLDHRNLLNGGLRGGEMVVIAGRPGAGKTTFALNIARWVASGKRFGKRHAVAFFSLEMGVRDLALNLYSMTANVPASKLRANEFGPDEYDALRDAEEELRSAEIYFDASPMLTPSAIRSRAQVLRKKHNIRVVIIDYLQLMAAGTRHENRQAEVASMSRALKMLARELDVCVLCLAQLNRDIEKREKKKPQLSDLRESGQIEADADVVMLVHRPERYEATDDNRGIAEVYVAKNRNGEEGKVTLRFLPQYLRFENLAQTRT